MVSKNSLVVMRTDRIGRLQGTEMKKIFAFLLVVCIKLSALAGDSASTRLIGYYSDIRTEGTDDPHFISGYNIALYQRNAETLAHVMVAIGSPEPVRAAIESLAYNPKNKSLSFTAKYSAGLETNIVKAAPDRESFKELIFHGVVNSSSISGEVGVRNLNCTQCKLTLKRVTLTRIEEMGRTGDLQAFPQ